MIFNSLFGLPMISSLTSLLFKVFLCISVYKDAKEHNDKNAVLWTILVAIFGLIPMIIYAIFRFHRDKEFVLCPHCGKLVSKKYPVCMYCKQPVNDSKNREIISEEVKKYLIIAAAFFVANLIAESIIFATGARQGVTLNIF